MIDGDAAVRRVEIADLESMSPRARDIAIGPPFDTTAPSSLADRSACRCAVVSSGVARVIPLGLLVIGRGVAGRCWAISARSAGAGAAQAAPAKVSAAIAPVRTPAQARRQRARDRIRRTQGSGRRALRVRPQRGTRVAGDVDRSWGGDALIIERYPTPRTANRVSFCALRIFSIGSNVRGEDGQSDDNGNSDDKESARFAELRAFPFSSNPPPAGAAPSAETYAAGVDVDDRSPPVGGGSP